MNRALVDLLRLHGVKPSIAIAIRDDLIANGMAVVDATPQAAAPAPATCVHGKTAAECGKTACEAAPADVELLRRAEQVLVEYGNSYPQCETEKRAREVIRDLAAALRAGAAPAGYRIVGEELLHDAIESIERLGADKDAAILHRLRRAAAPVAGAQHTGTPTKSGEVKHRD